MDNIQKTLVTKAYKKELSHLYHLKPTHKCENELTDWCIDLLKNIRLNHGESLSYGQLTNHEDILFINTQSKNYVLDDFNELFKFLNYNPRIFNYRYVVINSAHKMSVKVANKLLKTFEEPSIETCIFLLNNENTNLLNTIESRAVELRVFIDIEQTQEPLPHFEDHLTLAQKLKKDPSLERKIQKSIYKSIEEQNFDLEEIQNIQNYFEEYRKDLEYNNPNVTRAFNLHKILLSIKNI